MARKRRLFGLGLGKPGVRQAVEWEIEHHLDELTDRLVEDGWDRKDARREAERRFGDVERRRRAMVGVDRRRVMMRMQGEVWDGLVSGVRSAMRGLRRAPGVTVAVALTLGLGIGVNGTMFGIVDRLLLSPPPHVGHPDMVRRVLRDGEFFGTRTVIAATTYPDVTDLRTIPELASVGASTGIVPVTLGAGEGARRVQAVMATHDYFTTLDVHPERGRFPSESDDDLASPLTAVLSHEFWAAVFGSDPGILGRVIELDGRSATVIGVAPAGFTGVDLDPVDVWLPAVPWRLAREGGDDRFFSSRRYWWLRSVVRLRDGTDGEVAAAQATALHVNNRADLVAQGRFDVDARIFFAPLMEARGPQASRESVVARWLAGVSLVVLLIACANVANLLLAQGAARRREFAVRLSLGIARGRLVREMILETVLMAVLGGAVALALAHWGGGFLRNALIPDVLWTASPVNGRMLVFTGLLSALAGLVAGLGPAVQSTRADLARDLADRGRGGSRGRSPARDALTVAQAALSTVLLVGAGLFIRSVVEVRRLDLGLDVNHLVQATLEFNGEEPDVAEMTGLYAQAAAAIRGVPGVDGVTATDILYQWAAVKPLSVPGVDSLPIPRGSGPFYNGVTPGYLRTMGVEVVRGRALQESDAEGAPPVAVVNETMAHTLWPEGDAVGACFHVDEAEACTTIVGIAEDVSREGLEDGAFLAYYLPLAQIDAAPAGLYIRSGRSPRDVAAAVAPVLRSFSPRVRFAEVQPMTDILGPQTRAWTLGATLFSAFGGLALLVAAIGLYSLLAYDVAQRTREIGIRSALGARKTAVLTKVVATGTRLAVFGVALGAAISVLAARWVQDLLFHVEGAEPGVLVSVAALLLLVALVASVVPGLRATRIEPMEALRAE